MSKWARWNTESFISKCKEIHGDKFDYSECNYVNCKIKVKIKCNKCGNEWESLPHNHLGGSGCKICQYKKLPQNQPITHKEFIKKAIEVHGYKFEYITKYISDKSKMEIKCLECGYINKQRPGSHLHGYGCQKCACKNLPQNQPFPPEEFEKLANDTHQYRYEYYGDYKGHRRKVKILCKIHQEFFYQEAGAHLKGQGCPICRLSRGEIQIHNFLKKRNIEYEYEKKFMGCEDKLQLTFDFYIPNLNCCIEYDGEQHFNPVSYFGGQERFKDIQRKDEIKNIFCKKSNIKLIRIPYFNFSKI